VRPLDVYLHPKSKTDETVEKVVPIYKYAKTNFCGK
jgi:hypothetical protein